MAYKYTDDDYCDIYENKICDNCGKCLEMEGIDTKAIRIEDIAKTQEENKILEEEFLDDLRSSLDEDTLDEIEQEKLDLKDIYEKFGKDNKYNFNCEEHYSDLNEEEYVDAFEHIEYLDDAELFDDIDDMTEEIYPGVRRLKSKKSEI